MALLYLASGLWFACFLGEVPFSTLIDEHVFFVFGDYKEERYGY